MTQTSPDVNFYILSDSDPQRRLYFIYRLVEKSYSQGLTTLIITADEAQQKQLDKLIWTAKPTSFIPHECIEEMSAETALPPVVLTTDVGNVSPTLQPDVTIDLGYDATTLNHPKIMLVANQHPEILPNARMKYQAYANQGIKPNVYKIGTGE